MSISEEVKRLHELHEAGALTDAEFEAAKAKLFASQPAGGSSGSSAGTGAANDINRLRRSRNDRWLGGVCGGLGSATGVESWAWRLIFMLVFFFAGTGLLVYILMWLFVPEE